MCTVGSTGGSRIYFIYHRCACQCRGPVLFLLHTYTASAALHLLFVALLLRSCYDLKSDDVRSLLTLVGSHPILIKLTPWIPTSYSWSLSQHVWRSSQEVRSECWHPEEGTCARLNIKYHVAMAYWPKLKRLAFGIWTYVCRSIFKHKSKSLFFCASGTLSISCAQT